MEALQRELSEQRARLSGEVDAACREKLAVTATLAAREKEFAESEAALTERLTALLRQSQERKSRWRKEKGQLTELVASLEHRLGLANEAKQRTEDEAARLGREVGVLHRKVEQFRTAVQNEGLAQASGMMGKPHAAPGPFDEAGDTRGTAAIAALKRRVDELGDRTSVFGNLDAAAAPPMG